MLLDGCAFWVFVGGGRLIVVAATTEVVAGKRSVPPRWRMGPHSALVAVLAWLQAAGLVFWPFAALPGTAWHHALLRCCWCHAPRPEVL